MDEIGWTTVESVLRPGRYLLQGDEAFAEGAIAAGCNYYGGYPITPSSEVMKRICNRFAELGGGRVFIQMEDEIASIGSCIGASWAGAKAMTATSGPGLSLMLENLGYAIMTEAPVVVVDVQRAGPSTGQATRPAQALPKAATAACIKRRRSRNKPGSVTSFPVNPGRRRVGIA